MKRNKRKISRLIWFLGYYEMEISLSRIEDFLNICLRYSLKYYDYEIKENEKRVKITVPAASYKRFIAACKVWQIKVWRNKRFGLLEKLSKYRGRWGILVGALVSILLFVLAQSVIWRIDVIGNERLTVNEVRQILSENGIDIGNFISKISTDSIEQRVMINSPDIAWISINIEGTVASVEIREVADTDLAKPETHPANLVAMYDAEIVGMEVYSGFLNVNEGDFVRAGELLVSGIYQTGKAPIRYTRASGRIFGRVNHSFVIEIPLRQMKKVAKGEKFVKKTLNFFGKSIKFFTNYRNLPTSYDIINYVYIFDPFGFGELPISISTDEYYSYETIEVEIDEGEAIEQAYSELRQRIDRELPDAQILKKSLYGEFVDGKYILHCDLTAICDIARIVEFDVVEKDFQNIR